MKRRTSWQNCGLCGGYRITTREHVIPRALYPPSKASSKFQRITIAACVECNNGTADDDAHFRNVVTIAGDGNEIVNEVWTGPVRRAFAQVDGYRRARDLFNIMRPAPDVGPDRYRIYPADDERVMRIVRKIVRGLSRYHELHYPLSDGQVFADVMRSPIPAEIAEIMIPNSADPDILEYSYLTLSEPPGMLSAWSLRFYRRTSFMAFVFQDEASLTLHMRGKATV
ncbi:MAG: hypothetical protein KDK08_22570 [Rhizobiaceae bacterium]|nr:hypothetical protein [Rhizobiaceae bacterium]